MYLKFKEPFITEKIKHQLDLIKKAQQTFELLNQTHQMKAAQISSNLSAAKAAVNIAQVGDEKIVNVELMKMHQTLVSNYAKALDNIQAWLVGINLNEQTILDFHEQLVFNIDEDNSAKYRIVDQNIVNNQNEVILSTSSNVFVQTYVQALLNWLYTDELPYLIKGIVLLFDFMKTKPFYECNMEVMLLMFNLIMYYDGITIHNIVGIENVINTKKDVLYEMLDSVSVQAWATSQWSYDKWVEFMLDCILKAYEIYFNHLD